MREQGNDGIHGTQPIDQLETDLEHEKRESEKPGVGDSVTKGDQLGTLGGSESGKRDSTYMQEVKGIKSGQSDSGDCGKGHSEDVQILSIEGFKVGDFINLRDLATKAAYHVKGAKIIALKFNEEDESQAMLDFPEGEWPLSQLEHARPEKLTVLAKTPTAGSFQVGERVNVKGNGPGSYCLENEIIVELMKANMSGKPCARLADWPGIWYVEDLVPIDEAQVIPVCPFRLCGDGKTYGQDNQGCAEKICLGCGDCPVKCEMWHHLCAVAAGNSAKIK